MARYLDAHFRCEQSVEGFLRESGSAVDLLVQPIDMNPTSVAMCDCLYEIVMIVKPLAAGQHDVTLYRRWDAINEPNDPVLIGTAQAQVE
jgi:hypothetical protein